MLFEKRVCLCADATRMSVRQNLLEKRNQLERDLLAEKEDVSDKENFSGQKNLPESKSIRRAFGGPVRIVITEPPLSPQRGDFLVSNKADGDLVNSSENERDNVTDEGKDPENKNLKEGEPRRHLSDIIGGLGKRKAIKDVTIKNRHQVFQQC